MGKVLLGILKLTVNIIKLTESTLELQASIVKILMIKAKPHLELSIPVRYDLVLLLLVLEVSTQVI